MSLCDFSYCCVILATSVDTVRILCSSIVWFGAFLVRFHEISSDLR